MYPKMSQGVDGMSDDMVLQFRRAFRSAQLNGQNASGGFVEGRNGELRRTVKHFSYDAQVTTA